MIRAVSCRAWARVLLFLFSPSSNSIRWSCFGRMSFVLSRSWKLLHAARYHICTPILSHFITLYIRFANLIASIVLPRSWTTISPFVFSLFSYCIWRAARFLRRFVTSWRDSTSLRFACQFLPLSITHWICLSCALRHPVCCIVGAWTRTIISRLVSAFGSYSIWWNIISELFLRLVLSRSWLLSRCLRN